VDVRSLGYRSDLALLELGGSTVTDHGDHLVVRSPHNPTFYWGNFLLLASAPAADEVGTWLERYRSLLPDAQHVAIGVDDPTGTPKDLAPFTDAGFEPEVSTVMSASAVHPPPRPNAEATYRLLDSDDDWAQVVEVSMRVDELDGYEPVSHREFLTARNATNRATVRAGHGGWFGAFVDGRLVSSMGLYTASPGLARFQSVLTDPDHRGRGYAGSLVHHVSRWGFDELGARTLVMVADPEYLAIRIYRSVGFVDGEVQLGVLRRPPGSKTG
jgi:GNAT superfamily N-acetyltransferase